MICSLNVNWSLHDHTKLWYWSPTDLNTTLGIAARQLTKCELLNTTLNAGAKLFTVAIVPVFNDVPPVMFSPLINVPVSTAISNGHPTPPLWKIIFPVAADVPPVIVSPTVKSPLFADSMNHFVLLAGVSYVVPLSLPNGSTPFMQ